MYTSGHDAENKAMQNDQLLQKNIVQNAPNKAESATESEAVDDCIISWTE